MLDPIFWSFSSLSDISLITSWSNLVSFWIVAFSRIYFLSVFVNFLDRDSSCFLLWGEPYTWVLCPKPGWTGSCARLLDSMYLHRDSLCFGELQMNNYDINNGWISSSASVYSLSYAKAWGVYGIALLLASFSSWEGYTPGCPGVGM